MRRENSKRGHWAADSQEFPQLEAQRTAGNTKGPAGPNTTEMDRRPMGHPTPVFRNLDRGMRPTKDTRSVPRGNHNARTWGVQKPIVTSLSALAENFIPRKTSKKRPTQQTPTDNDLDRSLAKTGSSKIKTPQDIIECEIATIGTACPTEIGKPVADRTGASGPRGSETGSTVVTGTRFRPDTDVAEASGPAGAGGSVVTRMRFQTANDVAEASGPAATGVGGSVGTGKGFRTVRGVAEASGPAGTGAGGPVIAATRFLAVADIYAPFEETEGGPQDDMGRVDQISKPPMEGTSSHPLEHSGVAGGTVVSEEIRKRAIPESCEKYTDPDAIRETSDIEPRRYSSHNGSPNEGSEPFNTDGTEDTEDEDAIMVGVVGSAAPWFLTGWTNDVEVEFMIDTSCQVTILATSVFEKMCKIHPQVKSELILCTRRLVSADSSPLTVMRRINLRVAFPGLQCNMCCVVASIGSDGLLGTEALQLCLPHQLDLRTGQLWAEGRSTLQLHQQKPTPDVSGLLSTAVVLPPDSEVVANFSISGGQLGTCTLIDPNRDLTEEFGVVVGHTLVDASMPSESDLIINPNAEEVVLPCGSLIGDLVPVSAVSVARSEFRVPTKTTTVLPDYLEDIVKGSHNSLRDTGRQSLHELLHRYEHVFPALGEPVTGQSKSVQHEIETKEGIPVRCGPRRLAPAGLRREQECVKEMLTGGQIEHSDSPWASPVVLVTKKDGSTRFCVDYRRLNSLTVKDAYPLPRIDDSLRLLGNQQWFSTMDLVSGYWKVAMSPEAKRKAAFVTNEGLFQFRVMPFGLCNAPATFERLMDRVWCGMRWSR